MSEMPCSITDGPEFEEGRWSMDNHDWMAKADAHAWERWLISVHDLGTPDGYDMQFDPIEWVDQKAEKYGLIDYGANE